MMGYEKKITLGI